MNLRNELSRRAGCRATLTALAAVMTATVVLGQQPPTFDPQQFMDQFFGKISPKQLQRLESVPVSAAEEQQAGRSALAPFLQSLRSQGIKITSGGKDVTYLRKLLSRIQPLMKNARRYRQLTVLIAESPETDAKSFPGGTIVLYRGMLNYVDSEAMLVGVLGHELSHLDHGHQLRYLQAMRLAQSEFTGRRPDAGLGRMMETNMLLARMFARPFRPEEESVADEDGVRWAARLGYDPRAFSELFRRMARRERGPDVPLPAFFRSHPHHRDRFAAVSGQAAALVRQQGPDRLVLGRRNLQQRIPVHERRFAE